MYVYKTTNLINGKIYIGISRKDSSNSSKYLGSGKAFRRAVKEYGKNNFIKEVLLEDTEFMYPDLQRLEVFLIDLFDARDPTVGYNISKGGDGNVGETNGMFGKKHTPEAIDKLKQSIRLRFPPVNKLNIEGIVIKTYESITDVALDGYRPDLVKKVLKGENKLHGGFFWALL